MATTPQQEPTLEPTLDDLRNPGSNTTKLDRSEESSTSSLYGAAIGPIGKDFYLPIFSRFEAADRGGISWNWAASLTTLNWMAFRSLWGAALAYAGTGVGLALLIFGIGRLVFRFSEPIEMALLVAYLALMFVVPGLIANALLHADCRKRMARALAANTTLPEACTMLASQAPSRNRLIVLAVLNLLVAGAALGAYLNFPAAGSLPKDTMRSLATMDPLGTRGVTPTPAAPAASAASAASAPSLAASAAPSINATASGPVTAASAPSSAPTAAPTMGTSAPAAASRPLPSASSVKTMPATPKSSVSSPASATPRAPEKTSSAAGRVAIGVVQPETPRKAPATATASAPARAASAAEPASSSPQDVGKVYRSETVPASSPVSLPAAPVAARPASAVAGKPMPAPAAAKPRATGSSAKVEGAYLVNVGLFAQEANATNAVSKLKEANLPVYTEEVRSPTKGKLTRVRVGPFANRADADTAAAKVKALGLDALVARP